MAAKLRNKKKNTITVRDQNLTVLLHNGPWHDTNHDYSFLRHYTPTFIFRFSFKNITVSSLSTFYFVHVSCPWHGRCCPSYEVFWWRWSFYTIGRQSHVVDPITQPRGQEADATDHATQRMDCQIGSLDPPTTRWASRYRYCRCCCGIQLPNGPVNILVVDPTQRDQRGVAPADCWNWGKWGLLENIWKGSFLGWFVGLIVPLQ